MKVLMEGFMKKIYALIACMIMALLLLSACGAKEPEPEKANDPAVVGTWAESYFESGFVFNEDGTGKDTFWDLTFTYTAADGEMLLIYDDEIWGASSYTYSVSGNKLSMTRKGTEDNETFEYEKTTDQPQTSGSGETASDSSEGVSESESAEN